MRQSPTKVTFNYLASQNSQQFYTTRLIQSGFVLGDPVAFTDVPKLPSNYQSFSPKLSRPRAVTDHINSSRNINYEAPDPAQFALPPNRPSFSRARIPLATNSVSQDDYNRLLFQYNVLEERYSELEQKYRQALTENRSPLSQYYNRQDIVNLIERYRENLLEQFKMLMDRARLQQKQRQMFRK